MSVIEVVRYYHLELVDKTYKDLYGNVRSIDLSVLANLRVRNFDLNLALNKATIYVIDLDLYDKKGDVK